MLPSPSPLAPTQGFRAPPQLWKALWPGRGCPPGTPVFWVESPDSGCLPSGALPSQAQIRGGSSSQGVSHSCFYTPASEVVKRHKRARCPLCSLRQGSVCRRGKNKEASLSQNLPVWASHLLPALTLGLGQGWPVSWRAPALPSDAQV